MHKVNIKNGRVDTVYLKVVK